MVRVLMKSRFFDRSAVHLAVYKSAALAAALPLEARLSNQVFFLDLFTINTLTTWTLKVLLRHFSPLSLALLYNVHPYLHAQVFLVLAELVVHRSRNWNPLRWYLFLCLLGGAEGLVDDATGEVFLCLLNAVHALCMIRRLKWCFWGAGNKRWTDIIFHASSYFHSHWLVLWEWTMIFRCTRWCLSSLHHEIVPIWIWRHCFIGVDRNRHSRCSPAMHRQSFGVAISLLFVLLLIVHNY